MNDLGSLISLNTLFPLFPVGYQVFITICFLLSRFVHFIPMALCQMAVGAGFSSVLAPPSVTVKLDFMVSILLSLVYADSSIAAVELL